MGTNDQPGDYLHSCCAGCHVIYSNDREPRHSLIYAQYGRDGETATVDPTIAERKWKPDADDHGSGHGDAAKHAPDASRASDAGDHGALVDPADAAAGPQATPAKERLESGHPIGPAFTPATPPSQCMPCHLHQPNISPNPPPRYTMCDSKT